MDAPYAAIPWNTPALWREANACLAATIQCHRPGMHAAMLQADRLRMRLVSLFPVMDGLCRHTCPTCTDVCCQRAWVWIDFNDLLFLHLAGIAAPARQLLERRGERCRYAGPAGCRLDRLQRPFVCTWYVCPAQSRRLRRQPEVQAQVTAAMAAIKASRRRMDSLFIQALCR